MSINRFEKTYDDGKIKGYEREMISDGICKSFIPASFIREENRVKVIYDYDGYVKVSEIRLDCFELLELIDCIIRKIIDAADLFVDFNRISFDISTLFYNSENNDVRMAFVVSDGDMSFSERLYTLINDLRKVCDEDTDFLERLSRSILKENLSLSAISDKISKLKFELRRIG